MHCTALNRALPCALLSIRAPQLYVAPVLAVVLAVTPKILLWQLDAKRSSRHQPSDMSGMSGMLWRDSALKADVAKLMFCTSARAGETGTIHAGAVLRSYLRVEYRMQVASAPQKKKDHFRRECVSSLATRRGGLYALMLRS